MSSMNLDFVNVTKLRRFFTFGRLVGEGSNNYLFSLDVLGKK